MFISTVVLDVGTNLSKSKSGQIFTLQIFSDPSNDKDEGKTLIGQSSVSTDSSGNGSFGAVVAYGVAPVGANITVTTTGPGGNTSEFSDPRTVG
jgi:hypothetical protein